MATHIIAIVTFNRTSIHGLMFAIIFVLMSLDKTVLSNVYSFEDSRNHLNFDNYNVNENELYDEARLTGDGELYKEHGEIKIPDFYPEKNLISPLNNLFTVAAAPLQSPLGKATKFKKIFKYINILRYSSHVHRCHYLTLLLFR